MYIHTHTHTHTHTYQLLEDVVGDLGREGAETVLLASQKHVGKALALALAPLQLGHTDL